MNLSAFGLASLIGMAAAAYLARHGLPRQVTNLQQHTLLGFSPTGAGAPWHLQGPRGATASIEAGQRLRVDATPALHAAVMAGIGISLFTALTVQEDLRSGRLTRVLPAWKGGNVATSRCTRVRVHWRRRCARWSITWPRTTLGGRAGQASHATATRSVMDPVYLLVAVGAIVAGFVQGLSGFAFGMVAMSFWAWGLDPRVAAALSVFGALTGQLLAVFTVRRGFNLRLLLPFVLGGLAGIPLGVLVLPQLDMAWFKALLGGFLAVWCPVMLMVRRLPPITMGGRIGDAVAGMAGGVLSGIGGFAGPVPTLWSTLRGFAKDEQRAVIQNFNLAMLAVTMATYVGNGMITRQMLPYFAIVAPAMLVPTLLGARLYIGISEARFRQIVLGLLTASGIALLCSALPVLLSR